MKKLLFLVPFVFLSCNNSNEDNVDKLIVKFRKEHDSTMAALQAETDSIKASIISVHKDSVKSLLKGLTAKKDEFKKLTFYKNYTNSYFANAVYIYLVEGADGQINGRFKIEYTADDWLFIRSYSFLCDGEVYDYTPEYDIERDNSGGDIFEYSDQIYSPQINKIVKAIITSKVTKIRCNGDKYHDDRVITQKEKTLLTKMYRILNYDKEK